MPTYSIAIRIFQSNPARGYFSLVEQTVWPYANGGTWSQDRGVLTLTMGGSGTSGVLRLQSDQGELVAIAVGVHNYKRWCDIVTGLKSDQTALVINGEYYNDGPRAKVREQQLSESSATSITGTNFEVIYTEREGENLRANVIIG